MFMLLCVYLCLSPIASGLSLGLDPRMQAKTTFLQSITSGESTGATNAALDVLVALQSEVSVVTPLEQSNDSLGTWQICFAPHIRVLSRLLQTDFDVLYIFQPNQMLLSNVRYTSSLFGSGHLSTNGSYTLQATEAGKQVCKIKWNRIWWDVSDDAPTLEGDIDKHILPTVIQVVGKAAFVEGVSVFPVQYLDQDLCVFLFRLLGTRICAKRIA
jgi:hypothetical protein